MRERAAPGDMLIRRVESARMQNASRGRHGSENHEIHSLVCRARAGTTRSEQIPMSLRSLFSSLGKSKPAEPQAEAVHTTQGCQRFGHPEFRIRVSNKAIPDTDVAWFLHFLESRVAEGEKFSGGQSLQVGWMYTMIEETDDGFLRITEPDMQQIPVRFIDSVDSTLMHLRNQKDVVESLVAEVMPDFPSLQKSVVVHVDYKSASRILLTRAEPHDASDSGWWLSDLDDKEGSQDPSRFTKTSLYQLAIDRPALVKFFAVPTELQVYINGPVIAVLGPESEIEQKPGSYLSELNRARQAHA